MESNSKAQPRKKVKHYNAPGHAHELTFSCYHRYPYLESPKACSIFPEELGQTKDELQFELWAYVLMPNHVHLLIHPKLETYQMSRILQSIKGRASKKYGSYLKQSNVALYDRHCIDVRGRRTFRFWQACGGFDRNLWNPTAIHASLAYIENNPVRADLVDAPEKWLWSSAHAQFVNKGLVPDRGSIPMLIK